MQWFEKTYKKRFSSENIDKTEAGLDGINSSELWAQISNSIPQEEPSKKTFHWRNSAVVFLVFCLLTAGFMFFNNNNSIKPSISENNSEKNEVNQERSSTKSTTPIESQNLITQNQNSQKIEAKVSNTQRLNALNHKSGPIDENLKSNKPISIPLAKMESIETNTKIPKSITSAVSSSINTSNSRIKEDPDQSDLSAQKIEFNTIDSKKNSTKSDVVDSNQKSNIAKEQESLFSNSTNEKINASEQKNSSANGTIVESIDSRSKIITPKLDHNWFQSPERTIKTPVVFPFVSPVDINKPLSPWSIKFSAQINTFDQKYTDDTNPEIFANQANQSIDSLQYGSGFGLHLGYSLNKNWAISTGIESNRYKNKLSTVLTTNTIIFDTTYQKDRNAINTRTVRHTNKISAITIPLDISYNYNITRKFGIGTSIGLAYSLVTSQNVKLLARDNSFIDFDSISNKHFDNYLSLRFNPYIKYRLLNNFEISMDVGFSMQNHGSSTVLDLNHSSLMLSAGLGLKYNFR